MADIYTPQKSASDLYTKESILRGIRDLSPLSDSSATTVSDYGADDVGGNFDGNVIGSDERSDENMVIDFNLARALFCDESIEDIEDARNIGSHDSSITLFDTIRDNAKISGATFPTISESETPTIGTKWTYRENLPMRPKFLTNDDQKGLKALKSLGIRTPQEIALTRESMLYGAGVKIAADASAHISDLMSSFAEVNLRLVATQKYDTIYNNVMNSIAMESDMVRCACMNCNAHIKPANFSFTRPLCAAYIPTWRLEFRGIDEQGYAGFCDTILEYAMREKIGRYALFVDIGYKAERPLVDIQMAENGLILLVRIGMGFGPATYGKFENRAIYQFPFWSNKSIKVIENMLKQIEESPFPCDGENCRTMELTFAEETSENIPIFRSQFISMLGRHFTCVKLTSKLPKKLLWESKYVNDHPYRISYVENDGGISIMAVGGNDSIGNDFSKQCRTAYSTTSKYMHENANDPLLINSGWICAIVLRNWHAIQAGIGKVYCWCFDMRDHWESNGGRDLQEVQTWYKFQLSRINAYTAEGLDANEITTFTCRTNATEWDVFTLQQIMSV